ncbi:MAG TPA: T9SS type A sorting domain-containing protein [Chitinophagales bacterium]|nr:T9SS type A sorting domain-containing protein [Chitinophagales bacterium]
MSKFFFTTVFICAFCLLTAQQRFTLRLQPSTFASAPAVHSGAFGEYNGKWFFIGGRQNGLHGFQPPFAFPTSGINNTIYIVDPSTDQSWTASANLLPDSIREPITSSNMEFYLNDSMLYMVGGYGWKDAIQNFVTWPTLTAINMKGLAQAVISGTDINPFFRQYTDTTLAICGAHLHKLDSTYYLVFGHRFDGYYDRADTTGFFTQQYSHEIRKFQITDDGTNLGIYNYNTVRDTANFRRRDFNLMPLYDPYRGEGLLAYSGVFQKNTLLPYFTPIEIYKDTVIVRNDFNQNLSQYHSAVCGLYDSTNFLQHNIFFGGMSMYYMDTLTQSTVTDSLIPFVQTISDVARDIDMNYHEINAGIKMPALLGTNAYFLYEPGIPMVRKHFVHLNVLPHHQRLGYIIGGIESPELNISFTDPSLSFASARVFEVYLDTIQGPSALAEVSNDVLNFYAYPNPASNKIQVEFELKKNEQVKIELLDMKGALVKQVCNQQFTSGKQKLPLYVGDIAKGVYNCVITVNATRKSIRLQKD